MRIFLDTSILSEADLPLLIERITENYSHGDRFFISSLVHSQIEWGYFKARRSSSKYREFLSAFEVEVIPLTKTDSEKAASLKLQDGGVLDALIASTVSRLNGFLWTEDRDFLRFLPRQKLKFFRTSNS